MPEPTFTYDPTLHNNTGGYRGARGRIISRSAVRSALDKMLSNSDEPALTASRLLQDGRISVADWQLQMREHIKNVHLSAAASQRGGWAQMTPADFGRAGQRIKGQYEWLDNFAQQVADGTQRLDGTFLRRVTLYTQAGRETYHLFERQDMRVKGFDEERSVLGAADHCDSSDGVPNCVDEAAAGWRPIGDMTPIGQRVCRTN